MITKRFAFGLVALFLSLPALGQQSPEEQAVWKLEHSYWEDVKSLDLTSYKALWHKDFVGWPYMSSQPQRKDHITDWIAEFTDKGLHLQRYKLEPAASQFTDNVVATHYWLTALWVDKDGHGELRTSRITHTWIKVDKEWQILSGMSLAEAKARE